MDNSGKGGSNGDVGNVGNGDEVPNFDVKGGILGVEDKDDSVTGISLYFDLARTIAVIIAKG